MKSTFEKLYDAYYDSLYRYIYASVKDKWNAEDIISTVFMNIYNAQHKIGDVEASKNWVFRIAHNATIDFYRKNKKIVYMEEFQNMEDEESPLEEILLKDEFNRVKFDIEKLPEEVKQIIYMRYYGELKFKEISEILDKPESTIKSSLFRALEKVRKMYSYRSGGEINER